MDKYEFNIKVEQIKKLVGKSDYDTAVKIADTIDWRRVRNTNLLSMVAMVYEKNEDYQEAKAILLQAFERAPISKRLLYKLAELAVKEGNIEEAEAYYREFGDLASDDPRQQLLRYMILKAKGAPAQQLIHSLESYTSVELDEKWLYELAELYSLAGMSDRCVETCDRIMLMFGLGKYVDKAMELKIKYAPLTNYQMDLVENRDKYEAKLRAVEQEFGAGTTQTGEPEQAYESPYVSAPMENQPVYDHTMEMNGSAYHDGHEMPYPLYGDTPEPPHAFSENTPEMNGSAYADDQETPYPSYEDTPGAYHSSYEGALEMSSPAYGEDSQETPYASHSSYEDVTEMSGPAYEEDDQETPGPSYEDTPEVFHPPYEDASPMSGPTHADPEITHPYDVSPEMNQPMYLRDPELGQDMMSVEDKLTATMQDAAAQERLAREISKISYEKPVLREEPRIEHTRVLEDIRRVGHTVTVLPEAQGSYEPDLSGPLIEEDEPELEESSLNCYEDEEAEYEDYESEYPKSDYVYRQSAGYSEAFRQQPDFQYGQPDMLSHEMNEDEEIPYAPVNAGMYGEDPSQDHIHPAMSGEASEYEDLYDEAEAETEHIPVRNHLMIEAKTAEQGLQMAVEALKQIHKESGTRNPVAKITGAKLSKRGIRASAEMLAGKDLVIEEAGDLTREALEELNELMEKDTSGMIVVLIDNSRQMEKLHRENPVLASKFECIGSGEKSPAPSPAHEETLMEHGENHWVQDHHKEENIWQDEEYGTEDYEAACYQADESYGEDDFYEEDMEASPSIRDEEGPGFHGEEMGIDEFAQYACRYANEIDCNITGKSMLALYERIEIMEEDGIPLNRANAESLIEEAADRAEKPSFGKRVRGLFSTKYDKDGLLILKEEHFIY